MLRLRPFTSVTIFPTIFAAVIFAGAFNVSAEPAAKSGPGGNTKAGTFDDSIKPVDPGTNSKASEFDDSIRPINPAGIVGKGGDWDDSIKPADPSKPLRANKGTEAGATAIEYGKPVAPSAKKPDVK